ncbi:MAG: hypothetical protein HYU36_14015 [Planctomycetes bacterium]|nr:hypothetical protein [Planctomycetota bacterium]
MYPFMGRDRRLVRCAWSLEGKKEYRLKAGPNVVKACNLVGEDVPLHPRGGFVFVEVSPSPLYITEGPEARQDSTPAVER